MPKAVWVALPIALFFAVIGALALAKRPLSRVALNVLSSLLLLAYVAITAGLGVFWVANQQLPVFDVHYLFGYGTVVLLTVHLALNLRVVLAFLRRRNKSSGAEPRAPRLRLGWIGAAMAGLFLAFALGVRHGKLELRVGAGSGSGGPTWLEAVEQYHELSSHSQLGLFRRAPSVEWGDAPPPKTYPGAPRTGLPAPAPPLVARSVSEAIRGPGAARKTPVDAGALASILHHTSGVTHARGGFQLRASPSSGALFPAEVYVIARGEAGIEQGLYHFDPLDPALERLGDAPSAAALGVSREAFGDAPVVAVVTAVLRRTGHKYRDRAYRYAAADVGHLLENLAIAAAEHGLHADPLAVFDDTLAAEGIGVDGREEVVLAIVPLAARTDGGSRMASVRGYVPVDVLSNSPVGVTSVVHAATSLRRLGPKAAETMPAVGAKAFLPEPAPAPRTALDTIAARESKRTYTAAKIPFATLGALLRNAAAAAPLLSASVSIHVLAARVDGLAPGAYVFEEETRALVPLRVGHLQEDAYAAALSQDAVGGAAAVLVLAIDRDRMLAEGARGYRHAYLEVGMLGERLVLEATAHGLGVCPVGAFYDDDAAALIGVDRARTYVAHFIAVGRID